MKLLIIYILLTTHIFADRIYHKDGGKVDGVILEANETHVTFQREKDLQQFRFRIDSLASTTNCAASATLEPFWDAAATALLVRKYSAVFCSGLCERSCGLLLL